jgi:hypothetical protein
MSGPLKDAGLHGLDAGTALTGNLFRTPTQTAFFRMQ